MESKGKYKLIKPAQASEYLGIKMSTLYQKVSQKKIPYKKIYGKLMFDVAELDKFIEHCSVKPIRI